jgi:hypothetical protein
LGSASRKPRILNKGSFSLLVSSRKEREGERERERDREGERERWLPPSIKRRMVTDGQRG